MSDQYVGEIRMFGGNFAPRGWSLCNGQLLAISSNAALFSILGTTFGGDGQNTFALPDYRGRAPLHWGTGPGLSSYEWGQASGSETVTLISTEMPMHNHLVMTNANSTVATPANGYLGGQARGGATNYAATSDGSTLAPQAVGLAGGNQPHNNMQPYLCCTFIIALVGVFPSRN